MPPTRKQAGRLASAWPYRAHGLDFALVLMTLSCPPVLALNPGFYPLGYLSDIDRHSHGYKLSADGSVAVGTSHSASGPEAFRRSGAEEMVGIGDLSGGIFNSVAFGVSADGSVVVGSGAVATARHAFRWTALAGMTDLGDLPGGAESSTANAVSSDGTVVVGRASGGSGPEAFRWTQETGMVGIGDLPGGTFNSEAYDLSTAGDVVVGYSMSSPGNQAFRWTAETGMVGLGDLPGGAFQSEARGVSGDGSVVVGFSESVFGREAFRWTAQDGMVGLGRLNGGISSTALDVSADGLVIVGNSGGTVFAWDDIHGMRGLHQMLGFSLGEWQFIDVRGISDDGSTVIGFGRHLDGTEEAWIAVLPEPSAVALLLLGGLMLGRAPRRRTG